MVMHRPGPLRWVWYAYGGKLPERFAEWVLYDTTCRTWILRHVARSLTQMAPVLLVLFLPGPLWIRWGTIVVGVLVGLFYSGCFMGEMAEHRLIKQGYQPGLGRETRALHREARRMTKYGDKRPWWE